MLTFGILDVHFASADNSSPHDNIVQKIAEKFGLNQNDVQAVFDQVRQERQAERESKFEVKLSQAVTDGKITEEQKNLILNKHEELQSQREQNKEEWMSLSPEERKTQMEQRRTQLQNWAEQNGIDINYLFSGFGPGRHWGPGPKGGE